MRRWHAGILAVVCLSAGAFACDKVPRATAESFDATVQIQADGTVDVREQMALRAAPSATVFERWVAFDRADRVSFLSASIDGQSVDAGIASSAPIAYADGHDLRVRWEWPATPVATHALALRYRVRGAIELHGGRGHVRLRVLDVSRAFDVARARLALIPPPGTQLFDDSGMSEAGWTVVREGSGVLGQRQNLDAADVATVAGGLSITPGTMSEPTWQLNEERARQFTPAFISGGLFILVVGLGVLWIVRFEHPRRRTDDEAERRTVRRGLRLGGLACLALSGIAAVVTWAVLGPFGIAAMAVPAAILVVGLLFVALGGWIV